MCRTLLHTDRFQNCLLLQSVQRHGHKWTAIVSEAFPGRTALSAKNQFSLLRRNSSHSWDTGTPSPSESLNSSNSTSPYSTMPSTPCEPVESVVGVKFEDQVSSIGKLDFDWEGKYTPENLWSNKSTLEPLSNDWQNGSNQTSSHSYGYDMQQGSTHESNTTKFLNGRVDLGDYSDTPFAYHGMGGELSVDSMAKVKSPATVVSEAEVRVHQLRCAFYALSYTNEWNSRERAHTPPYSKI